MHLYVHVRFFSLVKRFFFFVLLNRFFEKEIKIHAIARFTFKKRDLLDLVAIYWVRFFLVIKIHFKSKYLS